MPENLDTIGDHLKAKRLKGNKTQAFVASLFSVDVKTINNWEKNKTKTIAAKYYPKIVEFLTYCPLEKPPTTFAEKIKLHRLYLGINQKQFAKFLNISLDSIANWGNGEKPSKRMVKKLKR